MEQIFQTNRLDGATIPSKLMQLQPCQCSLSRPTVVTPLMWRQSSGLLTANGATYQCLCLWPTITRSWQSASVALLLSVRTPSAPKTHIRSSTISYSTWLRIMTPLLWILNLMCGSRLETLVLRTPLLLQPFLSAQAQLWNRIKRSNTCSDSPQSPQLLYQP